MCVTHVPAVLLTFYMADPVSVIARRYAPSVDALFNGATALPEPLPNLNHLSQSSQSDPWNSLHRYDRSSGDK